MGWASCLVCVRVHRQVCELRPESAGTEHQIAAPLCRVVRSDGVRLRPLSCLAFSPVCARKVSDLRAKVQYYRERLSVYEALPEESLGDRRARAREWGRKSGGRGRSHGDQVGRFCNRYL